MQGERYFWYLSEMAAESLNNDEMKLYNKLAKSLIIKISPLRENGYSNWLRVDKYVEVLDNCRSEDINGFKVVIYTRNYWGPNSIHAKVLVTNDSVMFAVYKEKRTKFIVITENFINTATDEELGNLLIEMFNNYYDYWHRKQVKQLQ